MFFIFGYFYSLSLPLNESFSQQILCTCILLYVYKLLAVQHKFYNKILNIDHDQGGIFNNIKIQESVLTTVRHAVPV